MGEWQVVESSVAPQEEGDVKPDVGPDSRSVNTTGVIGDSSAKRLAEAPPEEDTRSFKLQKKTTAVGLGEIYDPGLIPIQLKRKEETGQVVEPLIPMSSTSSGPLKWTSISLKSKDASSATSSIPSASPSTPKAEESNGALPPSDTKAQAPPATSRWSKIKWDQPIKEEAAATSQNPQRLNDLPSTGPPAGAEEDHTSIRTEDSPVKLEPDGSVPGLIAEPLTTGLFKKRKALTGVGRGRR